VLVWIHGCGLTSDASRNYESTGLAADGIVVVTINFGLGALGFLAHPARLASTPHASHAPAPRCPHPPGSPARGRARESVTAGGTRLTAADVRNHLAAPTSLLPDTGTGAAGTGQQDNRAKEM
jgi:para-nitrobenzyl esterase